MKKGCHVVSTASSSDIRRYPLVYYVVGVIGGISGGVGFVSVVVSVFVEVPGTTGVVVCVTVAFFDALYAASPDIKSLM